jgi:glycosyltransferase involved in cell wall biosynthesis
MKPIILFLGQQSWRAGAERVLEEVLCAVERSFTPLVALPEPGPFAEAVRARGVETLFFPLGRYRSGPKSMTDMAAFPYRSARCAWWVARVIRERRVNLVYINGPRWLWAGALAARLTGTPSLFHLHMTLTRRADHFVTALGCRHVTKIVACSRTAAGALLRDKASLDRRLEVIYNPVRSFPPAAGLTWPCSGPMGSGESAAQPIIGVVGRITPSKGQHVALGALARLVQGGLNARLVLVGAPDPHSTEDKTYRASLESSTRALGLEGRVWLPGYQENPGPFYRAFDVVVIPTVISEGLPLVALEAMQAGVPVVGSAVGGIPEIVQDGRNGFLVPPGDENAVSGRLEQLLTNPGLRRLLHSGALATIDSRFSVAAFHGAINRAVCELRSRLHGSSASFGCP